MYETIGKVKIDKYKNHSSNKSNTRQSNHPIAIHPLYSFIYSKLQVLLLLLLSSFALPIQPFSFHWIYHIFSNSRLLNNRLVVCAIQLHRTNNKGIDAPTNAVHPLNDALLLHTDRGIDKHETANSRKKIENSQKY